MRTCKVGCVIMASGQSRRFGRNKLLEDWKGKSLIQRILELTDGDIFSGRVVVTRSEEVKNICEQQDVSVIFHDFYGRNDVVRLGVEYMNEMDGCIFCPCDQPFLSQVSLKRMIEQFETHNKGILRLCYGNKQGTPVLFGQEYFSELVSLPEKMGGSYLIRKYPAQVRLIQAGNELELFDIDTQEDYEWLIRQEIE